MLLKDLPIGTRVVDNDTKYFGEPIVWLVADKNHKGYPQNSVTLISEKLLCLKCFDAKEQYDPKKRDDNAHFNRAQYGNNNYEKSNINLWLNSEGSWYRPLHQYDNPPSAEYIDFGQNPYDKENGFLTNFSQHFKNALMSTDLLYHFPKIDGGNSYYISARVFLASTAEAGFTDKNGVVEGSKLELFTNKVFLTACLTDAARIKHGYSDYYSSEPRAWLLRSSDIISPYNTYLAGGYRESGNPGSHYAYSIYYGIRPLCNISSEISVSDSKESNGAHRIKWNQPPSKPDGIVIPDKIRSGKPATISWGVATDPDGESVEYGLDRQIDNNSWSRIYKGTAKEFTDNIVKDWNTVGYRVVAYDRHGAGSGYVTGETKTVINNEDPIISTDVNSNLGIKTEPFKISYIVDDADEERNLTVREYLDDNLHKEYTAPKSYGYDFQISKEEWREVINGEHKIKIVVEDSEGGTDEKVFTFSKNETSILLELKTPLEADDMVTKAIININRTIPPDAKMTVYICNNAFDDNPTWQNVTHFVLRNAKILILNEAKTADKWGVNIRVEVERNGATGDCFISSIGGVFE